MCVYVSESEYRSGCAVALEAILSGCGCRSRSLGLLLMIGGLLLGFP